MSENTDKPDLHSVPSADPTPPVIVEDPTPGRAPRAIKAAGDKPKTTRTPRTRTAKSSDIAKGVAQLYAGLGAIGSAVPSPPSVSAADVGIRRIVDPTGLGADEFVPDPSVRLTVTQVAGMNLVQQAPAIGDAWAKLADENPRVKETLERLLAVNTIGALVMAHAPVLLAVAIAAGRAPEGLRDVLPKVDPA